MSITVLGTAQVQLKIDAAIANAQKRADAAIQRAGIDTQANAKLNSPVKTGRLRAGYMYERTGMCACRVYNTVNYALPVETGHRTRGKTYVPPHPMLFPAYVKSKATLRQELAAIPGVKIVSWS